MTNTNRRVLISGAAMLVVVLLLAGLTIFAAATFIVDSILRAVLQLG